MDNLISYIDKKFRLLVNNSPVEVESPSQDDTLLCFEYEDDGSYSTHYIPADPKIVAGFIAKSDKRKLIANSWDYLILYADAKEIKESKLADNYMEQLYKELLAYNNSYCEFEKLLSNYIFDGEDE